MSLRRWASFLGCVLMLIGSAQLPAASAHPAAPHPEIDVLHYTFRLGLSDASNRITGEATVRVRFRADTLSTFRLDLIGPGNGTSGMDVTAVTYDGSAVEYAQADNHVRIQLPEPPATDEERAYTIRYAGTPADGLIISTNKYGDRTFFGDNWPNRARHWLPTVDHPSDKATVEWIVTAPERYRVIGNGTLVGTAAVNGGDRRTHWRTTEPLPTKVMVIGVADFAVEDVGTYDGTPIQSWVYPEDRARGFEELAQAERILQFFEQQLGDYPYAKLANVQSTTRYGGMENASAIFYSETAVGDTDNDEPLLAHEIAHQWYGNSVTETDWPHLWLSEGFATYLTQLYLEATYGAERLREGMSRARERVVQFAEANPEEPLVDTTYADPNELLNTNPYQKGAWVLHMLRHHIGDDAFWQGLRDYYQRYDDQNASTSDFRAVMENASGADLQTFFDQWTRRAGQPAIDGTWRYDAEAGQLTVEIRQAQDGAPYALPLEIGIYSGDGDPQIETLEVDQREHTFTFDLAEAPSAVELDPHVWTLMTSDFEQAY